MGFSSSQTIKVGFVLLDHKLDFNILLFSIQLTLTYCEGQSNKPSGLMKTK